MNIEELSLTEEEFNQDKNYSFIEFLGQATPTKKPEVTFVVAQPGAGKTGLAAYSTLEIKERGNGTSPINVNADRVAEYHKNYSKLLDYKPEDRFRITRKFVNPVIKEIQNTLKNFSVSMVIECTLNSDKKIAFMKELKELGYKININILAVDELESRISCLEREAALLKLGNKARGIDRESHDNAYENMLTTLGKVVNEDCWDNISVFRRGKDNGEPVRIFQTRTKNDERVVNRIKEERNFQRECIMSEPDKYEKRLNLTEKMLNLYQQNDLLKDYSLGNLKELRNEFKIELKESNKENIR